MGQKVWGKDLKKRGVQKDHQCLGDITETHREVLPI